MDQIFKANELLHLIQIAQLFISFACCFKIALTTGGVISTASQKLDWLILFNTAGSLASYYLLPSYTEIQTFALVAFIFNILFSLITFIFLEKMPSHWARFMHRLYFLYGIFVMPVSILGKNDFKCLCVGWLACYFVNALINRFANGYFPKSNSKEEYKTWLKIGNTSILGDIFQFRSEYSINTPGGHRQTFEKFYPYFNLLCIIYIVASSILTSAPGSFSLDHLVTSIDGGLLNGIVTYERKISPVEISKSNLEASSTTTTGTSVPPTSNNTAEPQYFSSNSLFEETLNRQKEKRSIIVGPSRTISSITPPASQNSSKIQPVRTIDLVNVRNLSFLFVLVATFWVVNGKSQNNSYAEKWKHLMSEAQQLSLSKNKDFHSLQFAANLIVTEMWGHRSFAHLFTAILSKHEITTNGKVADKLLEEINEKLAAKVFERPNQDPEK